jgi:hypothetical protein
MSSQNITFASNAPCIINTSECYMNFSGGSEETKKKKKIDISKQFIFLLLATTARASNLKKTKENVVYNCFSDLKPLIDNDFNYNNIKGNKGLSLICRHMQELKHAFPDMKLSATYFKDIDKKTSIIILIVIGKMKGPWLNVPASNKDERLSIVFHIIPDKNKIKEINFKSEYLSEQCYKQIRSLDLLHTSFAVKNNSDKYIEEKEKEGLVESDKYENINFLKEIAEKNINQKDKKKYIEIPTILLQTNITNNEEENKDEDEKYEFEKEIAKAREQQNKKPVNYYKENESYENSENDENNDIENSENESNENININKYLILGQNANKITEEGDLKYLLDEGILEKIYTNNNGENNYEKEGSNEDLKNIIYNNFGNQLKGLTSVNHSNNNNNQLGGDGYYTSVEQIPIAGRPVIQGYNSCYKPYFTTDGSEYDFLCQKGGCHQKNKDYSLKSQTVSTMKNGVITSITKTVINTMASDTARVMGMTGKNKNLIKNHTNSHMRKYVNDIVTGTINNGINTFSKVIPHNEKILFIPLKKQYGGNFIGSLGTLLFPAGNTIENIIPWLLTLGTILTKNIEKNVYKVSSKIGKKNVKKSSSKKVSRKNIKKSSNKKVSRKNIKKSSNKKVSRKNIKKSSAKKVSRKNIKKSSAKKVSRKNIKKSSNKKVSRKNIKKSSNKKVSRKNIKKSSAKKVSRKKTSIKKEVPVSRKWQPLTNSDIRKLMKKSQKGGTCGSGLCGDVSLKPFNGCKRPDWGVADFT